MTVASQLFNTQSQVDRITRQKLVGRVTAHWEEWKSKTGGEPEQYLAHLEQFGAKTWTDAQLYVGLRTGRSFFHGLSSFKSFAAAVTSRSPQPGSSGQVVGS